MALKSIGGYTFVPSTQVGYQQAFTVLLDGADEAIGWVFQANKTASLRKFGVTLTGITTGATMLARVETVDLTNGRPSGTLVGTNTSASVVIATTDANKMKLITLDADASLTAGSYYAVVFKNPSSSNGNMSVIAANSLIYAGTTGSPAGIRCMSYLGSPPSAWSEVSSAGCPCLYLEYDDGSCGSVGFFPSQTSNSVSFSTSATNREVALYVVPPITVEVSGMRWSGTLTVDADCLIYDSSGNTIAGPTTIDKDVTNVNYGLKLVRFSSPVTLNAGSAYRIAIKPSTTTTQTLYCNQFLSSDVMRSIELGPHAKLSTKNSSGVWSETDLSFPCISLIVTAFDDGASKGPVSPMIVQGGSAVLGGV